MLAEAITSAHGIRGDAIFGLPGPKGAGKNTLIITPLTLLGGSFYSIDMLPAFWQKVTLLNPVVYLISGFRWSFYASPTWAWASAWPSWRGSSRLGTG